MNRAKTLLLVTIFGIAISLDILSVREDGIFLAILYLIWDIPAAMGFFEKNGKGITNTFFYKKDSTTFLPILISVLFLGLAHHLLLIEASKNSLGWLGINFQTGLGESPIMGLIIGLLPVIYEEISRYGIFLFISRRHGKYPAIIISALLFSLLHFNSLSSGPEMYSLAFFSILMIIVRFVSGVIYINLSVNNGLVVAILGHFLVNNLIILPLYIFNNPQYQATFNTFACLIALSISIISQKAKLKALTIETNYDNSSKLI